MNIIITSGGTSESIDKVRKITNMSTGKLGSEICNSLTSLGNVEKIFFLTDIKLTLPQENEKVVIVPVNDTNSVLENLKEVISNNKIDYVIHSMAISDYTVETLFNDKHLNKAIGIEIGNCLGGVDKYTNQDISLDIDEITKNVIGNIDENDELHYDNSKKVSSSEDVIFIKLVKTPKIVDLIKKFDVNIKLISFKLLNGVSEEELIDVAKKQLIRTNSEFVIANDLVNIKNGNHRAIFVGKNNTLVIEGKQNIAKKIKEYVKENNTLFNSKGF